MSKQLVTPLQAEYLIELRKYEEAKKNFEVSAKKLERLTFLIKQEDRLRFIRDKKHERHRL